MAQNGKMVILRGNADNSGKSYPDEGGKMIAWPSGALHVQAAKSYADQRGYEPVVLDIGGYPQSQVSPQAKAALKLIRGDDTVHGLYGFSGGGYNVRHILQALADHKQTSLLEQLRLIVVLGSPNDYGGKLLYEPARFGVRKDAWELVFRCNPPPELMPAGLPAHTPGHMFGPDVLLAGWPEAQSNCHPSHRKAG